MCCHDPEICCQTLTSGVPACASLFSSPYMVPVLKGMVSICKMRLQQWTRDKEIRKPQSINYPQHSSLCFSEVQHTTPRRYRPARVSAPRNDTLHETTEGIPKEEKVFSPPILDLQHGLEVFL